MPIEGQTAVDGASGPEVLTIRQDGSPVSSTDADGETAALTTDENGRLWERGPSDDVTNSRTKTQPLSALGSGGVRTSSGDLHVGPCTVLGGFLSAATDAVWDLYDNTGSAAGNKFASISLLAKTSLPIPPSGLSLGLGCYANLVSGTGSAVIYVGPPVQ